METTQRNERRRDRHVRRLSQRALREAGTPTNVGRALGKAQSTISHESTTRTNPTIQAALELLIRLRQHPDVDPTALRLAMDEALDLEDLTLADDETLIARGLWLMPEENRSDALEDDASYLDPHTHAEALRRHSRIAAELAAILDELAYREIDLHQLYFESRAAAA